MAIEIGRLAPGERWLCAVRVTREPGAGRADGLDWGAGRLSAEAEARFVAGVEYCGRFFMGTADAQKALYRLTAILEAESLPYA